MEKERGMEEVREIEKGEKTGRGRVERKRNRRGERNGRGETVMERKEEEKIITKKKGKQRRW